MNLFFSFIRYSSFFLYSTAGVIPIHSNTAMTSSGSSASGVTTRPESVLCVGGKQLALSGHFP